MFIELERCGKLDSQLPNAINELQSAMAAVVFVPEIKEKLLCLGYEPLANTPQEFAKVMKGEFARLQQAVKASGGVAN